MKSLGSAVNLAVNASYVGAPYSAGFSIRMAYVVTKMNAFTTYCTFCHFNHLLNAKINVTKLATLIIYQKVFDNASKNIWFLFCFFKCIIQGIRDFDYHVMWFRVTSLYLYNKEVLIV